MAAVVGARIATHAIDHACDVFALSAFERELLVALLDRTLGLDGAARAMTIAELVAGTSGRDKLARLVATLLPGGTFADLALAEVHGDGPWLQRTIALDASFWPRLVGVHRSLEGLTVAREPSGAAELVLPERVRADLDRARDWLRRERAAAPTVVVHGAPHSGRGAIARALASELGGEVIELDGARLTAAVVPAWRRELAWQQAVPVIADADRADPAALAALVRRCDGPVLATSSVPLVDRLWSAARVVRAIETEPLEPRQRAQVWRQALARAGAREHAIDVTHLGTVLRFGPARITSAATALAADGETTTAGALAACRAVPALGLGNHAARLATPSRWSDLVVPSGVRAELDLIVTWARRASHVFAPGGAGERARAPRGLACLFYGPPGTGKTMAAQVIAGELGADLYRVDLAQIVDKYIGETEKRLDHLFREAEAAGAILLFDEADALFAKRTAVTEARDRYANLETSFLLQRLEDHAGLTILTTNLQANIDAAFHRRLGVSVEFPLPGPAERARIWDALRPASRDGDLDLAPFAARLALSGGDIRSSMVAAILLAETEGAELAGRHVAIAIWREMTKAGRMVDAASLHPYAAAVTAYAAMPRR